MCSQPRYLNSQIDMWNRTRERILIIQRYPFYKRNWKEHLFGAQFLVVNTFKCSIQGLMRLFSATFCDERTVVVERHFAEWWTTVTAATATHGPTFVSSAGMTDGPALLFQRPKLVLPWNGPTIDGRLSSRVPLFRLPFIVTLRSTFKGRLQWDSSIGNGLRSVLHKVLRQVPESIQRGVVQKRCGRWFGGCSGTAPFEADTIRLSVEKRLITVIVPLGNWWNLLVLQKEKQRSVNQDVCFESWVNLLFSHFQGVHMVLTIVQQRASILQAFKLAPFFNICIVDKNEIPYLPR